VTDVVAVGLITGVSGLLVGVTGAFTTYKVSKTSSSTAVETANTTAQVERERLEAEGRRLESEVAELERRRKSDLYERVLTLHTSLFNEALDPTTTSLNVRIRELHALYAAIQLTDALEVRRVVASYVSLVAECAKAVNAGETWDAVAQPRVDEFRKLATEIAREMRADIALHAA
jgi:hypothetical protein